jgi:Putative zinc-finger
MSMNHQEATRLMAVEKYILQELSPEDRDRFEEHFFDCPECAQELRSTASFIAEAKAKLAGEAAGGTPISGTASSAPPRRAGAGAPRSWVATLFRPAFAAPAFALLLMVIVYQNLLVLPRATDPGMAASEILPAVSLVAGNSRGGSIPAVAVTDGHSILVSVDIPTQEKFTQYECVLISPTGARLWRLGISPEQARDTVPIRISAPHWTRGEYTLVVQGGGSALEPAIDLARYRFTIDPP